MKLLSASILFAWALLVNNVSAGGLAGAYERIFFYLVYKLENDIYLALYDKSHPFTATPDMPEPKPDRAIGTGIFGQQCRGVNGGRCNFNEFVNWLNTGTASEGFAYIPRGSELGLDQQSIDRAAESIYDTGQTNDFKSNGRIVQGRTGFTGLFEDAAEAIIEASSQAFLNDIPESLDHRKGIEFAIESARVERAGVYQSYMLEWLRDNYPLSSETDPKSYHGYVSREVRFTEGGFTYEAVDWPATWAKFPELRTPGTALFGMISSAVDTYQTQDINDNRSHAAVVDKMDSFISTCGLKTVKDAQ